ncbi:Inner membrane protein YiaW [compost metagenome]
MLSDGMLDYFALGVLCFVVVVLFYGIIVLHDIPFEIARHRNHPHQDAIHAAGWVSLFTLHALWPFLWIWAMLYRPDRGWGFGAPKSELQQQLADLHARLRQLEDARESAPTKLAGER